MRSLKRSIKRRFGISATRLSVRPHVPWYVRWAITTPFFLMAGFLVWWSYDAGMEFAGFHRGKAETEIAVLRQRVVELESENAKQANQLAVGERQGQMLQASSDEIQAQIKLLQDENTLLKDDLAFFQNLPLASGSDAELSIHNLKIEASQLAGEYHCRMLLVQGVQRRGREFEGEMVVVVSGQQAGQKVVIQFPQKNAQEMGDYRLSFKYYQRVDHVLRVPAEMKVNSVEVKVFESGVQEPKVKKTLVLS